MQRPPPRYRIRLANGTRRAHVVGMTMKDRLARLDTNPAARVGLFVTGVVLVIVSPVVGAIPGPGGIFVFAAGLTLMLRASHRVKKLYARVARRWPGHVGYVNWSLRRRSHQRRAERSRQSSTQE
jgi:hypothetical protein